MLVLEPGADPTALLGDPERMEIGRRTFPEDTLLGTIMGRARRAHAARRALPHLPRNPSTRAQLDVAGGGEEVRCTEASPQRLGDKRDRAGSRDILCHVSRGESVRERQMGPPLERHAPGHRAHQPRLAASRRAQGQRHEAPVVEGVAEVSEERFVGGQHLLTLPRLASCMKPPLPSAPRAARENIARVSDPHRHSRRTRPEGQSANCLFNRHASATRPPTTDVVRMTRAADGR